ncbi:nucleoredoxin-like [Lineus longissimus]|uniref:nucleoredoxin-like n=1 Tax=Lineus longissimus TaxID=88925 RepID=UPI00315CE915
MSKVVELLGDIVLSHTANEVNVASICGEGKVIGLYYSAQWCSPCRAFTPKLIDFYRTYKSQHPDKCFEVVFISSDKSQEEFKEYHDEMPWLALPYEDRERKAKLSKKYKVQGIPTLVLIDGKTGQKLTDDGRSAVASDPEGKDFPWKPKPFAEVVCGKLINNQKQEFEASSVLKGCVKGIYFSAHWCPPCKAFTPDLVETYKKVKEDGKNFEVVFCSSDRMDSSFDEYFETMPWFAIPYKDSRSEKLKRLFGINGIPTLVILDEEDRVITKNGRLELMRDPEGEDFPWLPRPLNELNEYVAHQLNVGSCLILFTEGEDEDINMAIDALHDVADEYYEAQKNQEDRELSFFYGGDDEVCDNLRDFVQLEDRNPLLVISDIPEHKVYVSPEMKIDREVIRSFINQYFSDQLEPRIIKPVL